MNFSVEDISLKEVTVSSFRLHGIIQHLQVTGSQAWLSSNTQQQVWIKTITPDVHSGEFVTLRNQH